MKETLKRFPDWIFGIPNYWYRLSDLKVPG